MTDTAVYYSPHWTLSKQLYHITAKEHSQQDGSAIPSTTLNSLQEKNKRSQPKTRMPKAAFGHSTTLKIFAKIITMIQQRRLSRRHWRFHLIVSKRRR
ncbi:hypothetical protein JTE90_005120 [Oedothorax gibbosus]|uniref:Uncharacterized protein n=1 Tax=Oedothorax gibbosus TaxID=931172 RepID=A0AAV6UNE5_9ARAC|nr:hypothetical protein JTE90_005120 [Oedothorax gibbosus]